MKNDDFGDRMKDYEKVYTEAKVEIDSVLCVRLDGKGFSKFTKGFQKPFDDRLSKSMIETTKHLVKETHANIGYTQSDEITLIYTPSEKASEYLFGGKVSKLNSVLASMASASFNHFISIHAPSVYAGKGLAYFDCRTWAVPNLTEASNVVLWRTQDARKNSISALFRWTAGHKAMDGLDQAGMKSYLMKFHDVDWNDLSNRYKYGTYVKPVVKETYLTEEEFFSIPEDKRPSPGTTVKRSKIEEVDIGYFGDMSLEERISLVNKG